VRGGGGGEGQFRCFSLQSFAHFSIFCSKVMLGGWVNPHREQQTIPQGQTSIPPKSFSTPTANGQSAPRSGSARGVGRGAGSHTPSTQHTASESLYFDVSFSGDKLAIFINIFREKSGQGRKPQPRPVLRTARITRLKRRQLWQLELLLLTTAMLFSTNNRERGLTGARATYVHTHTHTHIYILLLHTYTHTHTHTHTHTSLEPNEGLAFTKYSLTSAMLSCTRINHIL